MSRRDISIHNLCLAAEQQGINPAKLVFATRVPLVEHHLARYRLADIFLDTHPYNAHTIAADALMAGLPVVTYMGHAFPARVAVSLLQAIGMPELIAHWILCTSHRLFDRFVRRFADWAYPGPARRDR
jgi:predicted O-linked N-acetylglucosamine transferase (SPINDLY family)